MSSFEGVLIREEKRMEKRLKACLARLEQLDILQLSPGKKETLQQELLTQIQFFQHERLVHLIVTVTFAILTFGAVACSLFMPGPGVLLLTVLLLVLLVPYIRHYYILENGVQKLYTYYDK